MNTQMLWDNLTGSYICRSRDRGGLEAGFDGFRCDADRHAAFAQIARLAEQRSKAARDSPQVLAEAFLNAERFGDRAATMNIVETLSLRGDALIRVIALEKICV
jgi:hypothetical protein